MGSTTALKVPKDGSKAPKRSRSISSRSSASSRSRSRSSSRSSRSSSCSPSSGSSSSASRSVSSPSSRSSSSKSSGYRRRFRGRGSPPRSRTVKKARSPSPRHPTRLYIGRLTRNVNSDHIHEIFSAFGKIVNVEMPMDRVQHHLNRGFAYVEYENPEDAAKAVKYMDGGQIDGQEISASKIDLQKARGTLGPPIPPRRNAPPGGSGGWRPNSPPGRRRRSSPTRRRPSRSRSRTPARDRRHRSSRSSSASSR